MEGTSIPDGGAFADGLPYASQFLMFEKFPRDHIPFHHAHDDGVPMAGSDSFLPFKGIEGVTVVPSGRHQRVAHLLRHGTTKIGYVVLLGPKGRNGAAILENNVETVAPDGANGSRLFVPVRVGHIPGQYKVIVHLYGGGTAINTIVVE
jgi:hypothetical protein